MTPSVPVRSLWPRRRAGLPPGQRALTELPRFSDKPLRPPPPATPPRLELTIEGSPVTEWGPEHWVTPSETQTNALHCVTTWSVTDLEWAGHRLAPMVRGAVADPPPFAVVSAADGASAVFVTEDLLAPDVLVATELNGAPLTPRHGAPLRLVTPSQYGYKNAKHVVAIDLRYGEPPSALGLKEHLRARVDHEERHARLPAWAVRLPYRLTIVPTAMAAERGLRRQAEPGGIPGVSGR